MSMRAFMARRVRRLRSRSVNALRRRVASRPPGDAWAFRLEFAARRVARALKRVEHALQPAPVAESLTVSTAGIARARVEQPLVLITQMARSGGTLLLHLLDGHPGCLVVPHELGTMLPDDALPRDPEKAFDLLTPLVLRKWRARAPVPSFDVSPDLVRALFAESFVPTPPATDRAVLDAYLSAYFGAWQGRQEGDRAARWVVGFEPGAIANAGRMERFATNYPDGRVISVLRDPWTWYASARRWGRRFAHVDVALSRWTVTIEQALAHHERRPEWIALVAFDDLVLRPGDVLGCLCAFLELPFDDSLLAPTLNGEPVGANSSFGTLGGSISTDPVLDRRAQLPEEMVAVIEDRAGGTWQRALDVLESAKVAA
jgi:hypothetical protein